MNLKVASLHIVYDGTNVNRMKDILKSLIGVPNIRLWYTGECQRPDNFAEFLVEWVLENGYIDTMVCTGDFLGVKYTFKSSNELSIYDTFNS
uniref:Calcineurin-like phosphoesterase domain-containing protein n=1 Tax=Panagrolaimus superbus TaxID=310955 RepID=A0A914YWV8_9BILA